MKDRDPTFDLRCDGHCVLITGGCGGLGAPAVEVFANAGAKVIILDRNIESGRALIDKIRHGSNKEVLFVQQDLSSPEATRSSVRKIAEEHGVDVLVNNAAIYPSKGMLDYSLEEYERVQTVNATAAFACFQAVAPGMMARSWGRVINIASITLSGGWPNIAAYVASKGTLVGLTRAIAREFGPFGITSNVILPGAFPTDAEKIQGDAASYNQTVLDRQAIKRRGTAFDFAYSLLFFASENSGFITGQSLHVDGGWVMH